MNIRQRRVRRAGIPLLAVVMAAFAGGCGENADVSAEPAVKVYRSDADQRVEPAAPGTEIDTAFISSNGETVGTATLTSLGPAVAIEFDLRGLAPGKHAIHIHETGMCEPPDFASAGDHFAPQAAKHGDPTDPAQGAHHAGDMRNQTASESGRLSGRIVNEDVLLSGGENALIDGDGAALIVHAAADDYTTQPAGDAGPRVACARLTARELDLSTLRDT